MGNPDNIMTGFSHPFSFSLPEKKVFNLIYIVHCQKKVILQNAILVTPGFLNEYLNETWLALLLTSQEYCCKGELEDAVDEWEGKHLVELLKGEGELDHGRTQLSVLHPCFQSNCAASERTVGEYMFLFFCFALLCCHITLQTNIMRISTYICTYVCFAWRIRMQDNGRAQPAWPRAWPRRTSAKERQSVFSFWETCII